MDPKGIEEIKITIIIEKLPIKVIDCDSQVPCLVESTPVVTKVCEASTHAYDI